MRLILKKNILRFFSKKKQLNPYFDIFSKSQHNQNSTKPLSSPQPHFTQELFNSDELIPYSTANSNVQEAAAASGQLAKALLSWQSSAPAWFKNFSFIYMYEI